MHLTIGATFPDPNNPSVGFAIEHLLQTTPIVGFEVDVWGNV
jgi:hypothetical protein